MSGGHFNHDQYILIRIADQIEHVIDTNEDAGKNRWGETVGRFYTEDTIKKFQETADKLRDLSQVIYDIDYLLSDNSSEKSFLKKFGIDLKELPSD